MRKSLLILLCAALSFQLFGQSLPSLLVPTDAGVLGQANTSLAGKAGAFAADVNLSKAVFSPETLSAGVSYGLWAPKTANDKVLGVGAFYKLEKLAFGLSVKNFTMQPYTPTSANGSVSQTEDPYTPKEFSIGLGAAFLLGDAFSLGVTARLASSALGNDAKGVAVGLDLSASYVKNAFSASLALCNLGPSVKYGENSYAQPMLVKAGASYEFLQGLRAQAQADVLFSGGFMGGIGAEYGWRDLLFARAGFHFGSGRQATATYASAGLGVHVVGICLDAAYVFMGENLRNTLLVTVGYSF